MSTTTPDPVDRSNTPSRKPVLKPHKPRKTPAAKASPAPAPKLKPHPLAKHFPPMPADEFQQLCESIRIHGLKEPIVVHQGQILDGHNRWRACLEVQVEPRTEEWDGTGSVEDFVVARNVTRRHLATSQRAILAVTWPGVSTRAPGRPRKSEADAPENGAAVHHSDRKGRTRDLEAEKWAVSPRLWADAHKLVKAGNRKLIERVRLGDLDVAKALRMVAWPPDGLEAALRLPAAELAELARKRRPQRVHPDPGPCGASTAAEPEAPAAVPADVEPAAPPPPAPASSPGQAAAPKSRPPKLRLQPRAAIEPGTGSEPGDTRVGPESAGAPAWGSAPKAAAPAIASDEEAVEAVRAAFRATITTLEDELRPGDLADSACRGRRWNLLAPFSEGVVELLQSEGPRSWAPCRACAGKGQAHVRPCKKCAGTGRGFEVD